MTEEEKIEAKRIRRRDSTRRWRARNPEQAKASVKKSAAKRYAKDPDVNRKAALKRRYGMTLDQWNDMFAEQEGRCAICGIHAKDEKKQFVVDHCHHTGKIRALLCDSCNLGIGHLDDDINKVALALSYLKKHFTDCL